MDKQNVGEPYNELLLFSNKQEQVVMRADPKSSHYKKIPLFLYLYEMMEVNQTYCANHFTMHVSPLCYPP